ncbi:hypothetical protein S83_047308, partial [Arachis hypogaea]
LALGAVNSEVLLGRPGVWGNVRKRLRRRYTLFPLLGALISEELSYKVKGSIFDITITLYLKDSSTLLFLDEPTSGLDSAASYYVMKRIKSLDHKDSIQRIVIASIHQPSAEVFQFFDNLCLLSAGKIVYFGHASAAIQVINILKRDQTNHHGLTSPIHRCEGVEYKNQLLTVLNMNKIKSKGVIMTALLAKATALALIKHPVVNSSCRDGNSFTYNSSINIAVAVATEGGLITLVLQDAEKVDVYTLSRKWKELVDKARAKQLQPHEYST